MVSRIERFSSIVKRCEGLMKGGVMKKKPIWYDVYVKHPPFEEPTVLREKPDIQINEIFYAEDIQRAQKMQTKHTAQTGPIREQQGRRDRRPASDEPQKKDIDLFDLSD